MAKFKSSGNRRARIGYSQGSDGAARRHSKSVHQDTSKEATKLDNGESYKPFGSTPLDHALTKLYGVSDSLL
jgi:hypothetical protein